MLKRLFYVLIIFFILLGSFAVGQQVLTSLQAGRRLEEDAEELLKMQLKNAELKKRLLEVQSVRFIEEQARDKLNLAKDNETVVVIPPQEMEKVLALKKQVIPEVIPNWLGWLRLFWK